MILEYNEVVPEIRGNSQKGQDSFIDFTFDKVGTTNKYYVEFGAYMYPADSNTSNLRNNHGWNGLLIEGNSSFANDNDDLNLRIRKLNKDNICNVFSEFNVPKSPDFVSIDIDSMDYWLTEAMLEQYTPRVIMVENNVRFEPDESWVIKYDPNWEWDGRKWYGASPLAFKNMFNRYGYTPVWIHLDDMIAIRNDVLEDNGYETPPWDYVYPKSNVPLYLTHIGHDGGPNRLILDLDLSEWQRL